MPNYLYGKIITSAAIFGALALTAQYASADERRMHSSACTYIRDNAGTTLTNSSTFTNSSSATSGRSIYCPVVTDSHLSHNQATRLNVHGSEGSGRSNYSRACVKHYNSTGVACGATRYWGNGLVGGDNVDLSTWKSNPSSFPYILTYLDIGGSFYGYWYTD